MYVGINLMPGMNTTIAAITTPTFDVGVVGLVGVILIVFAAMKQRIVASGSNLSRITGRIAGNLSLKRYGNPQPSPRYTEGRFRDYWRGIVLLMTSKSTPHPFLGW